MHTNPGVLCCVVAAVATLTGCSSSGRFAAPIASPTPAPTSSAVACPALAIAPPELAYPIPNATGVPIVAGDLVFYGSLPDEFTGTLVSATHSAIVLGAFTAPPSPLPTPLAARGTQPQDGGALAGVPYPALAAKTTYTISFSEAGTCPMTVDDPSYTFTTE